MLEMVAHVNGTPQMITVTPEHSSDQLREMSTDFLGNGVSRMVYRLNETMVLKVQTDSFGPHAYANKSECELWNMLDDDEQTTFARIYAYASDYSWIISEFIPNIGERGDMTEQDYETISRYRIGDLHNENYGSRDDGTFAVIDYGLIGNGAEEGRIMGDSNNGSWCDCGECGPTPEPCECFECDCSECYPEGCQCGTFEGCHYASRQCEVHAMRLRSGASILAGQVRRDLPWMPIAEGRGQIFRRNLHSLPTAALERLREGQQAKRNSADNAYAVLHTGGFLLARGNTQNWTGDVVSLDVCQECADVKRAADRCEDVAISLPFPDRFDIGVKFSGCYLNNRWEDKGRVRYYVRDRFSGAQMSTFTEHFSGVVKAIAYYNQTTGTRDHNLITSLLFPDAF